jgi:cardiolipin synthase
VRMGYLRELQAVGARVFRYQGRMLHSKAWLIDDRLAAMGSANLDGRSLFLNHEIMLLLHSRDSIATVGAHLAGLFQKAREGVPAAGPVRETLAGALRIFAPML